MSPFKPFPFRIAPRLAIGILVGLAFFAAGFALRFRGDYQYAPYVLMLFIIGMYVLLRTWISYRSLPALTPGQPRFQVSLPSGGFQVFHRFALPFLPLGFLLFLYSMGSLGEMTQDEYRLFWRVFPVAFAFLVVVLILSVGIRKIYFRRIALSLIGDEESLWIRGPFSWVSWNIAEVRVRRILSAGRERLLALEIGGGEEDDCFLIPAPTGMGNQRLFLQQLETWLTHRNVPVVTWQRVVPANGWLLAYFTVLTVFWVVLFVIGTGVLAGASFFWIHWTIRGTPSAISFLICCLSGVLAGIPLFLSAMRSWTWRLATGRWRRLSPGVLEVWIRDAGNDLGAGFFSMGKAFLRTDGRSLFLEAGNHRSRIRAGLVSRLERAGRTAGLRMSCPDRFYFARPISIAWTSEAGRQHSLFLMMLGGWAPGRNRRLERKLLEKLQNWLQQGTELDFSDLSPGPRYLGPVLAGFFLLACSLAFGIHDYLIGHYVRTGRLTPPAHVRPANPPVPLWHLYAAEAVLPGPLLGATDQSGRFLSWVSDPQTQQWRYLRPMMTTWTVPSQPGGVTHLLQRDYFPLNMMRFSFPWDHGKSFWPAQVISLRTGLGRDLTSLPPEGAAALYKDEKVFYAVPVAPAPQRTLPASGPGITKTACDAGWVEVREDQRHPLGRIEIEHGPGGYSVYSPPSALFFPGGRFVLFGRIIVDLETGTYREAGFPKPDKAEYSLFTTQQAFPAGNRLRIRLAEGAWPYVSVEILEIDPVAARVETIAKFPRGVSLLSADGDRWLLRTFVPSAEQPSAIPNRLQAGPPLPSRIVGKTVYTLYQQDLRTSETLFEQPAGSTSYYRLMAGRPELFVWSQKDGISIEPIEGKQSKKLPN